MRVIRSVPLILMVLSIVACSKTSSSASKESYSVVEGSLGYDISPVDHSDELLEGSYTSQGKTAKFRIDLVAAKASQNTNFSVGKGKFIPESGSEPETFLADLAKVLDAKKIPKKGLRSAALPFEYVLLAENQSRSKDGTFDDSPSGNWTLLKLFFAGDQAEVYLNLNVPLRKAEFSIKDPDYGDYLITEFAKVL